MSIYIYIYWITKFLHSRNFTRSLASNSEEHVKCASLNNRPGQARPILVNINSNETFFYPFTVANTIDDPYAQVCGPNKVNNLNVKVFRSII